MGSRITHTMRVEPRFVMDLATLGVSCPTRLVMLYATLSGMSTQTTARAALSSVVASNARAECARRGWTQQMLADRLGMSRLAVSDRHRERTPWTLDEVARMADLFGLEVSELVARPKGFEPLTFWLGVDHSIMGTRHVREPWWIDVFCDSCGWSTGDMPGACAGADNAARYAWDHSIRTHRGETMSGAA